MTDHILSKPDVTSRPKVTPNKYNELIEKLMVILILKQKHQIKE